MTITMTEMTIKIFKFNNNSVISVISIYYHNDRDVTDVILLFLMLFIYINSYIK